MVSNFLQQARSRLDDLKKEAKKFQSKDFLEASLGGSALIAMVDGTIDAAEKTKMLAFIQNHEVLSVFDTLTVVKSWKDYIETMELDEDIGEAKAMSAIGKMKGKDEQARLILRMVCAIGAADGDFDADEQRMAARIARELGLDPAEFDLA